MNSPSDRDIESIKELDLQNFKEFVVLLNEINESPLTADLVEKLKVDFGQNVFTAFLLYEGSSLAGIAVLVKTYSVIHAQTVLNLDEIFIRDAFRRKGLGKVLFDHVVSHARSEGYMRLEWRAEKGNTAAENMYAQYETDTNWTYYVMDL